eukprot:TRINITY_DN13015_c0_g1_i1.p1 TRINITY_DN13015_c0_g1~~TRINITY_DN13015_c0_g1_i1.p1  ORF type:complete len:149 (+),score=46.44 TRINITY_DN13015_c0_g1_i1:82-528(+)
MAVQERLAEFQGVFDMLDKDKKGYLDFESLKAGMEALQLHPKDQDVRKMIMEADVQKTGTIGFQEFVNVMRAKLDKLDSEEDVIDAFITFDRADKGWIPVDELRRALTTQGDKLNDAEWRAVAKEAGSDGHFDYEKFVKKIMGTSSKQ